MRGFLDKTTWKTATSVASPAAAVLPGDQLVIAWRGDHNSRNITVAVVNERPPGSGGVVDSTLYPTILSDSSAFAPALACYSGRLWLAWTGINEADTVNVAEVRLDADGAASVGGRTLVHDGILGAGAISGPSLSGNPYFDQLSLHALATGGQMVDSSSRPAGSPWRSSSYPFARNTRGTMIAAPDGGGDFVHAWTADDGRLTIAQPMPGTPMIYRSAQTSQYCPALASWAGGIYIAWTGMGGYLNVGRLDFTEKLLDPIVDIDTLDAISIAAPILIDRPPLSNPERLVILWTGADGGGAVSAGLVYLR